MTYELSKKLKEAGFPQKYPSAAHNAMGQRYWMHDPSDDDYIEILHDGHGSNALDDGQLTLIPTLEELIEACGKLHHFNLTYKEVYKNWRALGAFGVGSVHGDGQTANEAVANLWLVLHEQDTKETKG